MKNSLLLLVLTGILTLQATSQTIPNGATCPDFTVTDTKGKTHNLYTYCDEGKYVVLDFFTYWCGTCMFLSAPIIEEMYKKYGCNTGNLIVLGNECDPAGTLSDLHDFDIGAGLDTANSYPAWPGSTGGSTIGDAYGIGIFPTICIIGPDRKMINNDAWPFTDLQELEAYFPAGILNPKSCDTVPTSVNDFVEIINSTFVRADQASQILTVNSEKIQRVDVINQIGQTVKSKLFDHQDEVSIDTRGFSSGLYFIKVTTTKGGISKSVFIQ